MDPAKLSAGTCPVARALAMVGDAWSILILRDLFLGLTRFDQFRASLRIAPNILAGRLRSLETAGLVERRRYSERPPREEYVLSEAGRDFQPILQLLGAWGRRHNGAGRVSRLVDARTGEVVEPVVIDERTGTPLGSRPLRMSIPAEQA